MNILSGIFAVLGLAIVAYLGFDFVKEYRAAPGSAWDRALAAGKGSATILWARFTMIVGAISTSLVSVADWLNAPGIGDAIKSALSNPKYVAAFLIGSAVLTEAARRRTL